MNYLKNSKYKENQRKTNNKQQQNEDINDIIYLLKNIFNHYSKNALYLSNNQFKLFLIEASILDHKLSPEYSDTLFYSSSNAKDCINFNSFFELIIKISKIKFPEQYKENNTKALFLFFQKYLSPLIDIYQNPKKENCKSKNQNSNDSLSVNDINHKLIISKISSLLTKEIIEENYLLFLKIYQKYFCFENLKISRIQKNHLSQRAFIKSMEDFNISPEYLNSDQIENIFNRIIDNRDYTENIMNNLINIDLCNNDGMWFTLFHFVVGIYLISIFNVIISNYDENNPNNIWEIFIHNKDSDAFENIIKLIYKSPNLKNVMPEEIKKMQMEILEFKSKGFNNNDEEKNNQSLNGSNAFNKILNLNKEKENKNSDNSKYIINEKENIKNKTSSNYYSNNSKQNTLKSNKSTTPYKNRLLSNFVNNRLKKNKSFTIKNNKRNISSIIDLSSKKSENPNELLSYTEIAPLIVKKYKKQLISVYKYYSELYFETIFSIYMTQNGFINFIKDLKLLENNSNQINYQNLPGHQKFLIQKKRANLLNFSTINLIFSKFSSVPTGVSYLKGKNKSGNKRINFLNFIYIILNLANKIFNPKFNNTNYDDKYFSYDQLTSTKFPLKFGYNFVAIYINPLYKDILPVIEEDNFNLNNLKVILENERLNLIGRKIIPLFIRILKNHNDNKEYIGYSQYFKCLSDFNIFPDFVQRTKMIKIFINFIENFDEIFLLQGNNKIVSPVENCAYGLLYIGIGGNDTGNIICDNNEIKLLNFMQKIAQSENLGKLSILNLRNTLQKDFLNTFFEIQNFILGDNQDNINESFN